MILAPNWKRLLVKAHSVKAMALVVIFEGLNQVWPYVEDYIPVSKLTFGLITMGISMAAIFLRLSYQPKLHQGKHDE